jgi:hypothetical protein
MFWYVHFDARAKNSLSQLSTLSTTSSMFITVANKILNSNVQLDVPKQPYTLAMIAFQSLVAAVVTAFLNRVCGIGEPGTACQLGLAAAITHSPYLYAFFVQ